MMSLSWQQARALALAAELADAPLGLERRRIEGAVVETTRSYPGYYFGNRFILDQPPRGADLDVWLARYRDCFGWRSGEYPAVLSWYEPHGNAGRVGAHGVDVQVMYRASDDAPARNVAPATGHLIAFSSDRHWQQLIDLELAAYSHGEAFTRWRASSFRALMDAGLGTYYGIVNEDDALLCAGGSYYRENVARFAGIITSREYRGRGLASALITELLSRMRESAQTRVIVAESSSRAAELYESLGFTPFCYSHSLQIDPPKAL